MSIAEQIAAGLKNAAKDWKSPTVEMHELKADLEKLRQHLDKIKKLSRTAKSKFSDKQRDLAELDVCVAKLSLHVQSLEEE